MCDFNIVLGLVLVGRFGYILLTCVFISDVEAFVIVVVCPFAFV